VSRKSDAKLLPPRKPAKYFQEKIHYLTYVKKRMAKITFFLPNPAEILPKLARPILLVRQKKNHIAQKKMGRTPESLPTPLSYSNVRR